MSPRLALVVRYRSARSRLARFVTGSLAAHGVLVAVILVIPMLHSPPPTFDDAMVVALAGPLPGPPAPPAPAAARPAQVEPAPAKAPEPKEAHTVPEVPKPIPKKKEEKKEEKPAKSPAPHPAPTSLPEAAPEQTPSPDARPGGVGGGGTGPSAAGPTGITAVLGGGDASLGFYGAAVKAALESAWMKPYLEEQGETYAATVTFVISRDGTVRDVKISSSSGVPSLDRSAVRAVMEASPLPPIPPTWQGDTLPATMRFDLTPEGR